MAAVALPIPVVVTRHQCPFCRITRAKKQAMAAHIARCWTNPAARACKTCVRFEPAEEGPYPEHPGFPAGCEAGWPIDNRLKSDCRDWRSGDDLPF
ncbi:hypothetical protein ACFV90_36885 [Streptomyces sp. NPDC059904]|uniref:hypothetical protein n=1 Tax=Streptomyces sp. NPDC059904 TaxID=3346996 RepID=UPI0036483CAC